MMITKSTDCNERELRNSVNCHHKNKQTTISSIYCVYIDLLAYLHIDFEAYAKPCN